MLKRRTQLSAVAVSVVVALLLCAAFAIVAIAFSDVAPGDDYAEAINDLSGLGIIDGKADGTFRPRELVTRQQFAKMIVLTLGLNVSESDICPFSDVDVSGPGNLYPDNYVAVAAARGITKGVTASWFAPFNNITRAQVMSMVVRSAPLAGISLRSPGNAYYSDPKYTQRRNDDPTHGLNAQIAEINGLLWGIRAEAAGSWDASKNATRGEVAQILWRLRQKMAPPTTSPPTTLPSNRAYFDDFSDPSSGWLIDSSNDFSQGYKQGVYAIELYAPQTSLWDWAATPQGDALFFADAVVEVDAHPSQSSGSWAYGLMFRWTDGNGGNNFYQLIVNGDGTAGMWAKIDGQWQQLSEIVELPRPAADGVRHLGVTMLGDSFTGYVDDVSIGPVSDPSFAEGVVGIVAGAFDASNLTVTFDNFAVYDIVY